MRCTAIVRIKSLESGQSTYCPCIRYTDGTLPERADVKVSMAFLSHIREDTIRRKAPTRK
jgi:hypothetical protein